MTASTAAALQKRRRPLLEKLSRAADDIKRIDERLTNPSGRQDTGNRSDMKGKSKTRISRRNVRKTRAHKPGGPRQPIRAKSYDRRAYDGSSSEAA